MNTKIWDKLGDFKGAWNLDGRAERIENERGWDRREGLGEDLNGTR